MERIKRSYDDLHNKIRPGTTWVAAFTQPGNNDDLRSIDSDGSEMRFIPESRYYASCTIKRGQAVSIAQLEDLSEKQANNKYAYVKVTDPDVDDTCLGIAMNYAEPNQIVQIQRKGKFNYLTTDSILNTEENRKYEIFLNAKGWTYDDVRGQKLFIKKVYDNITHSGKIVSEESAYKDPTKQVLADAENKDAFDTDHTDESVAADNSDWFTYDFYDSIYNARNTIQIGYLTDAPTTDVDNKGYYVRSESQGEVHFYDSDNQGDGDVFGDKAVVVEYNKTTGQIEIVDGSGPIHVDGKQNWWEELQAAGQLPKAHEALWLVKGEVEVEVEIDGKTEKRLKTVYTPVDDQVVTVELDITGDTRGPIDNTQFVLTLGETIYFDTYKHDVDYNELDADRNLVYAPHYNAGIFDELKVVAIAKGNPRSPSFRVFNKTSVKLGANNENELNQGFISVRKLDGDTYIIPVLTHLTSDQFKENVMPALIDVNDEGYYKLSKQFSADEYREYIYTNENGNEVKQLKRPSIQFATEPLNEVNRDTLRDAIKKALKAVYRNDETGNVDCETTDYNIGDNGFFLTTNQVGGYYDIYISSEVLNIVSATEIDHGQYAKAGEAILADIRDSDRLNIAGVVLSNQSGYRKRGETIKVMKIGRIVTLGNLLPGEQYFLGLNGRITAKEQFWYDHSVSIGTAESSNYFIVNVNPHPQHSYSGNFPLGYIKPSINCRAEQGYLLADGITLYSKQAYPELYKLLLNWFDEEELKPSNISEDIYTRYRENQVQTALDSLTELYQETAVDLSLFKQDYQNKMLEIKSTDELQSSRLNTIEALDKAQNERLNAIEAVNKTQTERLDSQQALATKTAEEQAARDLAQDEALQDTAEAIRKEESDRATAEKTVQDEVDRLQNTRLDTAESVNAQQTTDISNQADKDTELEGKIDSNKSAIDKNAENIGKNASAAESALNEAKGELQKSIESANATIKTLQGTVTNLSTALQTTKDNLATTQAKTTQLEGLLRLYAATTAKETVFTLFSLSGSTGKTVSSDSQLDETFNLLEGFSATLAFNIEDDPNWRASAYSELLFNDVVVSNERSYTGTVNSDLTVQHRNTLTGKESATKTIRFVDPVEPENPTDISWLRTQDPDSSGILNWSSHFTTLVNAAITQNSNQYDWSNSNTQYTVEYSSASKGWTQVSAPYNLSDMFGSDLQINLRLKYKVYDIIENSKECIINFGTVDAKAVQRHPKQYKISNITTSAGTVADIQNTPESSLSAAFNGSFTLKVSILGNEVSIPAKFTDEYTIQLEASGSCIRSSNEPVDGRYEFTSASLGMVIWVTIEEIPVEWCTVD